jgi:hypothetical protein
MGFIGDNYFWFRLIVLNQHKVFLDIVTGHINTEIFETLANSEINIRIIFRGGVCVQRFFWWNDFYSNNSEVFQKDIATIVICVLTITAFHATSTY